LNDKKRVQGNCSVKRPVCDRSQAALHGVLNKVPILEMPLFPVIPVETCQADAQDVKK
jgi:hypothetical protein